MRLAVQFRKGEEAEGDIEITNGFLSFYKTKEGMPTMKLIILEYTTVEAEDAPF